MKSFKEYLLEARKEKEPIRTGVLPAHELVKHISKTKLAAIHRHPYFKKHVHLYGHPVGYKFNRDNNGFESVEASNGVDFKRTDGRTVKDMVRFDLSSTRHAVNNAHHFTNTNGERVHKDFGGGLSYEWKSSHKKDEE
jgi:hypothetical protein